LPACFRERHLVNHRETHNTSNTNGRHRNSRGSSLHSPEALASSVAGHVAGSSVAGHVAGYHNSNASVVLPHVHQNAGSHDLLTRNPDLSTGNTELSISGMGRMDLQRNVQGLVDNREQLLEKVGELRQGASDSLRYREMENVDFNQLQQLSHNNKLLSEPDSTNSARNANQSYTNLTSDITDLRSDLPSNELRLDLRSDLGVTQGHQFVEGSVIPIVYPNTFLSNLTSQYTEGSTWFRPFT